MPRWKIIGASPPGPLVKGGEVLEVVEADLGNAALEAWADATGRPWVRVNNDRIRFLDDATYSIGILRDDRALTNPDMRGEEKAITLRAFIEQVAQTYDRAAPMNSGAQILLRSAPQLLADYAPIGFIVTGSGGAGNPATIPWFGFLDPDETSRPHEGLYVVWLFDADMQTVWLTLIQGIMDLHERVASASQARALLAADGERIRAALPAGSLDGLQIAVDLHARGRLPSGYEAGAVAARAFPTANLPADEVLRRELERFFVLYADAIAAKQHLLLTQPGSVSTPAAGSRPPVRTPLEDFKPKDASDYRAQLSGGEIVKARRHEALIRAYGEWAKSHGFRVSTAEHPKDLVLRRNDREWLVEGKVLYRGNAAHAVRGAIGQLLEYERFLYDADSPRPALVALFTEPVGDAYVELLEAINIAPVWRDGVSWLGSAAAFEAGLIDFPYPQ
ncbi:hypothetical protein AYO48_03650 [Gaiella sp. SCGC AG-212-M14]|nr:hypothetical protein AYO48_03650 [Gaiella sp. SCGC AG-212-M14]